MKIDREYIHRMCNANPDEFDKLMESKSIEDFLQLKDYVEILDENHKILCMDKNIKKTSKRIMDLYQDLIKNNLLKINVFSFDDSTLETMKDYQARKEINDKMRIIEKGVENFRYFILMNEIYSTLYEKICSLYLKQISESIIKKRIIRKGKMIKIVKEYKNSKYVSLFKNLNSKIRNSISHEDFYINKNKPEIIFYEKGKTFLTINRQDYEIIFNDLINIQIGFDITRWDLVKKFEYELVKRIELVSDFLKKNGVILVPSKKPRLSVYEMSEILMEK